MKNEKDSLSSAISDNKNFTEEKLEEIDANLRSFQESDKYEETISKFAGSIKNDNI